MLLSYGFIVMDVKTNAILYFLILWKATSECLKSLPLLSPKVYNEYILPTKYPKNISIFENKIKVQIMIYGRFKLFLSALHLGNSSQPSALSFCFFYISSRTKC